MICLNTYFNNNNNRRAIDLPSRGDLRPSHDGKKVKSHGKFSLRPQRPGRSAAPTIRGCVFPARSAALGPVDQSESANSCRRHRVQPWTDG